MERRYACCRASGARPRRRAAAIRRSGFPPPAWPRTMSASIVRCSSSRSRRPSGDPAWLRQRSAKRHLTTGIAWRSRASRARYCSSISGNAVLHSGDRSATRPRRALKHGDTLRRARQPRRHRRVGRRARRPLPLRHALSLASRAAAQRHAAAAARLERARRQHRAHRRSHQSGHLRRRPARAAEGHAAHRAHDVPLARHAPISGCASATTATGRSSCS